MVSTLTTSPQQEMIRSALLPLTVMEREEFLKLLHEQLKVRTDLEDAISRALSATKHVGA
jgi:hypothetical protein